VKRDEPGQTHRAILPGVGLFRVSPSPSSRSCEVCQTGNARRLAGRRAGQLLLAVTGVSNPASGFGVHAGSGADDAGGHTHDPATTVSFPGGGEPVCETTDEYQR
jgi:hypothetical protein